MSFTCAVLKIWAELLGELAIDSCSKDIEQKELQCFEVEKGWAVKTVKHHSLRNISSSSGRSSGAQVAKGMAKQNEKFKILLRIVLILLSKRTSSSRFKRKICTRIMTLTHGMLKIWQWKGAIMLLKCPFADESSHKCYHEERAQSFTQLLRGWEIYPMIAVWKKSILHF